MAFTIPVQGKKEDSTSSSPVIFTEKDVEQWIKEGETVNSSICALLVGDPKTGKTMVTMNSRTQEEVKQGKKIIYIEMNSDRGGSINKKEFYNNDPNIIVIDPRCVDIDIETGDYNIDYIKTMAKIKSILQVVKKKKDEWNIKAIVFDGVDAFLNEICEKQLRIEKHVDAAGGLSMTFWKIRNDYFYKVIDMLLTIDIDKYLITHYKEDGDGKKVYAIQVNMISKMHQVLEFHREGNKFYVKIVSDRRKITDDKLGRDFLLMEQTEKGVVATDFRL